MFSISTRAPAAHQSVHHGHITDKSKSVIRFEKLQVAGTLLHWSTWLWQALPAPYFVSYLQLWLSSVSSSAGIDAASSRCTWRHFWLASNQHCYRISWRQCWRWQPWGMEPIKASCLQRRFARQVQVSLSPASLWAFGLSRAVAWCYHMLPEQWEFLHSQLKKQQSYHSHRDVANTYLPYKEKSE